MTTGRRAGNRSLRTAGLFVLVTGSVLGLSLLMNAGHLGVNAAIHWDARAAVCNTEATDPMPGKAALLEARAHVFDAAMGATDPRAASYYFTHPVNPKAHEPLETVRRYYTEISWDITRQGYALGLKWTGSPTGGIVFFQLSAAIAMAAAVGLIVTISVETSDGTRRLRRGFFPGETAEQSSICRSVFRSPLPVHRERARVRVLSDTSLSGDSKSPSPRPSPGVPGEGDDPKNPRRSRWALFSRIDPCWWMLGLLLIAVVGNPVMLSLSRQMLTEPAGFLFMAGGLAAVAGLYRPSCSTGVRILLSILAGYLFFLTVRTRYTLGVTSIAVTPVVIAMVASPSEWVRRWRSYAAATAVTAGVVAVLIATDVMAYGPFIYPWEYQRLLVKTTRLYFNTRAGFEFDPFWTALYVNGPLIALPLLVVAAGLFGRVFPGRAGRHRLGRADVVLATAGIAMAGLLYPLTKTGAQQVGYQPRHLFPFSAGYVAIAVLVLPIIRWRWFTAGPFAIGCGIVIAADIASTLGPQRTTMAVEFPPVFTDIIRGRSTEPVRPPLWKDLLAGYYDWGDNRRVHDALLVFRFVRTHPAPGGHSTLVVLDDQTEGVGWEWRTNLATGQPTIWWRRDSPAVVAESSRRIRTALAAGDRVFLVCRKGLVPNMFPFQIRPTGTAPDLTAIFLVVRSE